MGMGEPLHNLDNVIPAIQIMIDGNGLQLSNRRVTVSTCGLVPEMERLGREIPNVNLAVSLNATTDELRDRLMPINRVNPLRDLIAYVRGLGDMGRKRVLRVRDAEGGERLAGRSEGAGAAARRPAGQDQPHPLQPLAGQPLRMLGLGGDRALLRHCLRRRLRQPGSHAARPRHPRRLPRPPRPPRWSSWTARR